MKRKNSHYKRTIFTSVLILFIFLSILKANFTSLYPSVLAAPATTLAVDPSTSSANPGQYFTVNVTVTDVTNLAAYGFKLGWSLGLLDVSADNITEGPFLKQGGSTSFTKRVFDDYIDVGNAILGATAGVNGSGTLATATFEVTRSGNCTLELYDTTLLNVSLLEIPHTSQNGYFYTTWPVARYSYTPHPGEARGHPIVNETITFNATESYDPDGGNATYPDGIVSYTWDFDDGNITTTSTPIITHHYDQSGSYRVVLNVTDDEDETDSVNHPIIGTTIDVQFHDIAVIDLTVTPTEVSRGGQFTVNVTVLNQGSHDEWLNVTLYANMQPVHTELFTYVLVTPPPRTMLVAGENQTATIAWDTTGLSVGTYSISVKAFLVRNIDGTWQSLPELEREADLFNNGMFYGDVKITYGDRHDLAVTMLKVAPIPLKVNEWLLIDADLKNEGTFLEHFNATITIEYESNVTTWTPPAWSDLTIPAGITMRLQHAWFKGSITTNEGSYAVSVTVVPINATTLDFLQPYNASTPDDDPLDNTLFTNVNIRLYPAVGFTYSPDEPVVDQTVTLNASSSFAPGIPGGTIEEYIWDFGDGAAATMTVPTTTHTYRAPGNFTVTLIVKDEGNLRRNASKTVEVKPFRNIAITALTFSPHMITSGDSVSIDVTINTRFSQERFNVTAYFDGTEIATQSNIEQLVGEFTTLTFTWDTTGVAGGNYTVKAIASTRAEDTTLVGGIVTIERLPSTITLTTSPTVGSIGTTIALSGIVSTQAQVDVTIWQKLDNAETWSTLGTVTTAADGTYSYSWTPETAGTYAIVATWQGSDTISSSESEVVAVAVQAAALSPFLYSTVGLVILLAVVSYYFLKVRKPVVKSKPQSAK